MNLLYLTFLDGDSFAGPTYSVPKQIESQSRIDNVYWYNYKKSKIDEWKKYEYYHDFEDYKISQIDDFPVPFNKPDLIIVEQFYDSLKYFVPQLLLKSNIPYIIIPRGELTADAQNRKKYKKSIANFLIMKRFARHAIAIQYLTNQEKKDSGVKWCKNCIVIPNGIDLPSQNKASFNNNMIRCISVGRISTFHKGIDLLIKACYEMKEYMIQNNCSITLYGPDSDGEIPGLKKELQRLNLDNIVFFKNGIFGNEKKQELMKCDVFFLTSRFEGHPMALIEALSYGIPCLVTKGSNMSDEIERANAGWTAENNSESIANAIKKMISETQDFTDKGRNARLLSEEYSWQRLAKISHNDFKKIVEGEK